MEHRTESRTERSRETERISRPGSAFADTRPGSATLRQLAAAMDNSPRVVAQRKLAAALDSSPRVVAQRKLAERLSARPAQRRGAPLSRVQPASQTKGVAVNDDATLEREADVMGARAIAHGSQRPADPNEQTSLQSVAVRAGEAPVQRVVYPDMAAMWAAVEPTRTEGQIRAITNADTALTQAYADVAARLAHMDFIYQNGQQPEADLTPVGGVYPINYGLRTELNPPYDDVTRYVGAILHEMMHIAAALQFATNVPGGSVGHGANMNLPAAVGVVAPPDAEFGLTDNQFTDAVLGARPQVTTMFSNWDTLGQEADLDRQNNDLTQAQRDVIHQRIHYAKAFPGAIAHYDTVLFDILYYLQAAGVAATRSYAYAHRMLTEANARRLAAVGPVQAIPRAPLPIPPAPRQGFWAYLLSLITG